jgi:hypothetical protein
MRWRIAAGGRIGTPTSLPGFLLCKSPSAPILIGHECVRPMRGLRK